MGVNQLVTICLPAYEDVEAVERAILSLKKQTFQSWECIIGDDSQSDAIEKMILKDHDRRIRYFHNMPAKGIPCNWNSLISIANGEYITLLHQDDFYINKDVLELVIISLENSLAKIAICSYSIWENEKFVARYNDGNRNIQKFLMDFPHRSLIVNRIGHPSVIFFQNSLKEILFDEDLCYFLDTDWYARLWQAGGEPFYISNAEIGIERKRKYQLSQQCIHNFKSIDSELEKVFKKWNTTEVKIAIGFARLYASHLRHIKFTWPSFTKRIYLLSHKQKYIFFFSFFIFFLHMLYRVMRKFIGLQHWA